MKPIDVKVRQTAPGRYVGEFDAADAGSYLLMLSPGPGMAPILSGVNVPYSAEFLDREPNEELMKALAGSAPRGAPAGLLIEDKATASGHNVEELLKTNTFRHDLPPAVSTQPIWHLLALIASCVFLADVFVRRVHISFAWVPALAGKAVRVVLRRPAEAAPSPVMARLRSRKAEVAESLEQQRAAARFEPTPQEIAETPAEALLMPDAGPPKEPPKPAGPVASDQPTEQDDYTSRLLKAKKKVWDERKK
jgi:hypothetical protein